MKRLTVSLPDEVEQLARNAAGGKNVSAWVARAIERRLLEESLLTLQAAGRLDPDPAAVEAMERDLEQTLAEQDRPGSRAA